MQISPLSQKILILLYSLFLHPAFSVNQIVDLATGSTTYFKTLITSWTPTPATADDIYTLCSGNLVLGGYGVGGSFERSYSSIGGHNIIYFQITIFVTDYWPPNDKLTIYFDSVPFQLSTFGDYVGTSDICGESGTPDGGKVLFVGKALHTASTLTLKFTSSMTYGAETESYSVRDIYLNFGYKTGGEVSQICGNAIDNPGPNALNCTCSNGDYWTGSACAACDTSCETCFGSGSTRCFKCKAGYYYDGSSCSSCDPGCNTCVDDSIKCSSCSNGVYLFKDQTCGSTCNSPLSAITDWSSYYCLSPCLSGYFLYWDGTCIATCTSPLSSYTYVGDKYCTYPCGISEYLYENGSCLTGCGLPFQNVFANSRNFCNRICSGSLYYYGNGSCLSGCSGSFTATVDYLARSCDFDCSMTDSLYTNGSCITGCSYPFVPTMISSVENYCRFTCSSGLFLYANGSCISGCSSPFVQTNQGIEKYCDFSCGAGFRLTNGSCLTTCTTPFFSISVTSIEQYCYFECPSGTYRYANGTCSSSCTGDFSTQTLGVERYCNFKCPIGWSLLSNGSCISSCPVSFTLTSYSSIENYCAFTCATGLFWYANASCISTCTSPFTSVSYGLEKYCNFACGSNQQLRSNGSCSFACDAGFVLISVSSIENYCNFACGTDYLYGNGSCITGCNSPFSPSTYGAEKYCTFICASNRFYNSNSTCISSCSGALTPIVLSSVEKYCKATCTGGFYYYANGSCINSCSSPYTSFTSGIEVYCNFPCSSSQGLYTTNSSCITCTSAFIINTVSSIEKYCSWRCGNFEFYFANGSCLLNCPSNFVQVIYGAERYCRFPCSPTQYMYSNGTCTNSCPSSFYIVTENGNENYCFFRCPSTTYYYGNGSCISTCPSPFTTQTNPIERYCNFYCPYPEYYYTNSSCKATCASPLVSTEYSNLEKYCKFPCNTTEFYYSNGSCIDSCSLPFINYTQGIEKYCNFPCPSSYYLYWNNTCLSSCDSPLIANGTTFKSCSKPCTNNQYYYQNGSCLTNCSSPFIKNNYEYLCTFPCSSSQFMLANQTCVNSCDSPYITVNRGAEIYCNKPCRDNMYLFPNYSCISTCPFPMKSRSTTYLACDAPCTPSTDYYYTDTQTCNYQCIAPRVQVTKFEYLVCDPAPAVYIPDDIKYYASFIEFMTQTVSKTTAFGAIIAAATAGVGGASSIGFVALSKMLFYTRYFQVNYTTETKKFVYAYDTIPSLGYNYDTPEFPDLKVDQENVNPAFSTFGVYASFISNYWANLLSCIIIGALTLFAIKMEPIASQRQWDEDVQTFFEKLKQVMKWNIPLLYFCSCYSELYISTFIGFQASKTFSSALIIMGMLLSICFMAGGFVVIGMIFRIARRITRVNFSISPEEGGLSESAKEEEARFKNFRFLFQDFKKDSFISLSFLGIFLAREILFDIFLVAMADSPTGQSVSALVLGAGMLLLIGIKRPFVDPAQNFKFFVLELINMMAFSFLAILSTNANADPDFRTTLSLGVNYCILLSAAFGTLFMGLSIIFAFMHISRISKELKENEDYTFSYAVEQFLEKPPSQQMNIFFQNVGTSLKNSPKLISSLGTKIKSVGEKFKAVGAAFGSLASKFKRDPALKKVKPASKKKLGSTKVLSSENVENLDGIDSPDNAEPNENLETKAPLDMEKPSKTANLFINRFQVNNGGGVGTPISSRRGSVSNQRLLNDRPGSVRGNSDSIHSNLVTPPSHMLNFPMTFPINQTQAHTETEHHDDSEELHHMLKSDRESHKNQPVTNNKIIPKSHFNPNNSISNHEIKATSVEILQIKKESPKKSEETPQLKLPESKPLGPTAQFLQQMANSRRGSLKPAEDVKPAIVHSTLDHSVHPIARVESLKREELKINPMNNTGSNFKLNLPPSNISLSGPENHSKKISNEGLNLHIPPNPFSSVGQNIASSRRGSVRPDEEPKEKLVLPAPSAFLNSSRKPKESSRFAFDEEEIEEPKPKVSKNPFSKDFVPDNPKAKEETITMEDIIAEELKKEKLKMLHNPFEAPTSSRPGTGRRGSLKPDEEGGGGLFTSNFSAQNVAHSRRGSAFKIEATHHDEVKKSQFHKD